MNNSKRITRHVDTYERWKAILLIERIRNNRRNLQNVM